MGTTVQAIEGLRHVYSQDIDFEHGIRNDKEEDMDILSSRHDPPCVECYLVRIGLKEEG